MIDIIYRYNPRTREPIAPPATPGEAMVRLCDGNRHFVELADVPDDGTPSTRVIPFDLSEFGLAEQRGAAPRQQPFAVVLGCSDARVPTELVFSQACNALFVVRVAGNVLGSECLGSIDYAVQHLGENVKLLVVLGHSGCGAVTAAVDVFLDPATYLTIASTHALRSIVDSILVAVRSAAHSLDEAHGSGVSRSPGYRAALIEISVALNAALTAKTLWHEFREVSSSKLKIGYGVYHLVSRIVNLPLGVGEDNCSMLFEPPTDADEFRTLGLCLASSQEIAGLLAATQGPGSSRPNQ
jgi:carbonic anhydrase